MARQANVNTINSGCMPPADRFEGQPVTAYEDEAPANTPGPRRAPLKPPLLIEPVSDSFYVLNQAGAYVRANRNTLHAELARAHPSLDLEAMRADGNGKRRQTVPELFENYGHRINSVQYDYRLEQDRFEADPSDAKGGTLWKRAGPRQGERPDVSPKYHADIDTWLKRLAGEAEGRLLDWLATLHLLDRPTAALMLTGPPGAGKGMLAAAVTVTYGGERVTLDAATSRFNARLLDSPVVHLDEAIDGRRTSAAKLRSLIAETTHEIEEKYGPRITLNGCPRVIITTNNPDALKLAENLTAEDEAAVGSRVILIEVPNVDGNPAQSKAGQYLSENGGRAFTASWVTSEDDKGIPGPGRLCEHIRWLQLNRAVQHGGRFLVAGDPQEWRRRAGDRGGMAGKILAALVRLACEDGAFAAADYGQEVVRYRGGGEAWIRVAALHSRWENLTNSRNTPPVKELSNALANLSIDGGPVQRRECNRERLYRVSYETVARLAENHGLGSQLRLSSWFGVVGQPHSASASNS